MTIILHPKTLTEAQLIEALTTTTQSLLYPSESDYPITIKTLSSAEIGEKLTLSEVTRHLYTQQQLTPPQRIQKRTLAYWTKTFFGNLPLLLIRYSDGSYSVQPPEHPVELWRTLHGLVFDHLIHVALWHCILNGVESDLHLIGRHVLIQHNPDINAANLQLGNWVALSTRIVQT